MSWNDHAVFTPEALVDGQGRQIMWSWIFYDRPESQKNHYGWTGTYSLPRSLWLGEDGTLRMKPVDEIKQLRLNEKTKPRLDIASNQEVKLNNIGAKLMEIQINFKPNKAKEFGVKVAVSEDGDEETVISYDREENKLKMDTRNSRCDFGRNIVEEAPLNIDQTAPLELRIFVDKSIIEVFANNRQAISRRIYPEKGGTGVSIFSNGGNVVTQSIKAWEMMPSNPF